MKTFLLRCPKCHHNMKYQSQTMILTGKRKSCVYCNHSFKVRTNFAAK
ncbi:MAG: hypothetical protein KKC75_01410 [Nanoarchaeota archaeon]|nr:hypothetical protein [Nanoarchaeota archaeon]MBU1004390.1 hypothetical protein [Nanoarchaeota archaeon]MBU1946723.1 hypothetical protein [Nanoarchaeota archaeon]